MNRKKLNEVFLMNYLHLENFHETITSRYGLVYEHPAPAQKIKYQDNPADEKNKKKIKDEE